LVGVALFVPALGPALVTGAQYLAGSLTVTPWVNWSRTWAGGVMSVLILLPVITTLLSQRPISISRRELAETGVALIMLTAMVYVVFWTLLPQANIFVILYLLLAVLFWVGLRLGPRVMAFSLFLTTAMGMAGSLLAHPSATPLNQQLFADELFMILIAPIFLILSALVEERRVTAQRLSESISELQGALSKLGKEDESKNEFIATLAHELRNPLAPVVSTLEYLKLAEQKPETHRLIESAEEQTHIMRRLLDDLLDVARVTQKQFKLQKETVTLQAAITRSVHTVEVFMNSRQHTLTISMPAQPLWVYGDPVRLTQIFTNLLYNAAKYTNQGGMISISARAEGALGIVEVADNGVGIDEERLARIFEPFVHTQPRSTVGTGLGIGLSITQRLVEMHEGSIGARSGGKSKGSTFTVALPLALEDGNAMPRRRENSIGHIKSPYRILVVDDNAAAAQGIEKLLTHQGHDVSIVYDGLSALTAVTSMGPQVVLLDIGLPDLDGYEVARRLRAAPGGRRMGLIAITGYGQAEDQRRAYEAGFDAHLTKPVAPERLKQVMAGLP
jgi:signal transduction histidine kinase